MVLMIIIVLIVLGLCFGSFVNALVWRIHEQESRNRTKVSKAYHDRLSISKGRSMCPSCHHELAAKDLLPVLSWLSLRGKCRYCQKAISIQYPLVELLTAGLFVISYIYWPLALSPEPFNIIFGLWLILLIGLMALLIYDLRWMILPNRIVYPVAAVAAAMSVIVITISANPLAAIANVISAMLVGGGVFYILFQVSAGKWIGGGDVRLGFVLGLIVGTPARSVLVIFLASVLGCLAALPLVITKKLKSTSLIPFGPFLIVAAIIVELFGAAILHWYRNLLIVY